MFIVIGIGENTLLAGLRDSFFSVLGNLIFFFLLLTDDDRLLDLSGLLGSAFLGD